MKVEHKEFEVETLLNHWRASVTVNREYQRGAVWTTQQKQMLVDSVFRGYPLPMFYFYKKTTVGLDGSVQATFEVIDGQQRLLALDEFRQDRWRLLHPVQDDKKMRLPARVKQSECPWGGRAYSELTQEQKDFFLRTKLQTVVITDATPDEVRDLFIRLQSGTSLSRQQI